MRQNINMANNNILNVFLTEMRDHPNKTAFRMNDNIVTNALFVQRIAPIMNELDALPDKVIGLVIEDDLQVYASIPAFFLSDKILVPIKLSWTEEQRQKICQDAGVTYILTAHRMQYYFRMTYEDALDRIDNGLYDFEESRTTMVLYGFKEDGTMCKRDVSIQYIPSSAFAPKFIYDYLAQWL